MDKDDIKQAMAFACEYLNIPPPFDVCFADMSALGSYDHAIETVQLCKRKADIETLFHEMVHRKQYLAGWLKSDGGVRYWKKNRIKGAKGYSMESFDEYWNSPHERQARDIAANMLRKYTEIYEIQKQKD